MALPHCSVLQHDFRDVLLLAASQAVTTLVSMNDNDMVDTNIDAVLNPLNAKEKEVVDHIEEAFFCPLKQRHWEGVEIAQYWKVMKERGLAS